MVKRAASGDARQTPGVAVCIISFRAPEALRRSLSSVLGSTQPPFTRVVVADNASAGDVHTMLAREFPTVELLASGSNLFFLAYRRPFIESTEPYFLILNQDVFLAPETLARLVAFMEAHPSVGAVAPMSRHLDNSIEWIARPRYSFQSLLSTYTFWRFLPRPPAEALNDLNASSSAIEVDVLQDSCLLVRRSAIAGELYDWKLKLYFTEDDLAETLRSNGFQLYYLPEISVQHIGQHSSSRSDPKAIRWLYYHDMFVFSRRWFGSVRTNLVLVPSAVLYLAWRYLRTRGRGTRERNRGG